MTQRRALEAGRSAGSGLRARVAMKLALREGSLEHELTKSPLVLGRGSSADIVVSGPLVSRRHAQLSDTEHGLVVTDLASRNGVFVNGRQITAPVRLAVGDRLAIGDSTFVLVERPGAVDGRRTWSDTRALGGPAGVAAQSYAGEDSSLAVRHADVLQLLGNVVDKALAVGRAAEAEHVIGSHLGAALSDATSGRAVPPEVARSAAQYAVKLATATGKAAWLDFVFRLYHALGQTIPLPIVDEMYTVLRRVRSLDRELLRSYSDFLRARGDRLSAPERFVLQRLEGLQRLAALHPAG